MENRIQFTYWDSDQEKELCRAVSASNFQVDLLIDPARTLPDRVLEWARQAALRSVLVRILIPDPGLSWQDASRTTSRRSPLAPDLLEGLEGLSLASLFIRTHRRSDAEPYLRADDAIYFWMPGAPERTVLRFDATRGSSRIRTGLPGYFEDVFLQSRDLADPESQVGHSVRVADLAQKILSRAPRGDVSQRGYELETLALAFFKAIPGINVMAVPPDEQGFDILLWSELSVGGLNAGPLVVEVKAWMQPIDARVVKRLADAARERGIPIGILFSFTPLSRSGLEAVRSEAARGLPILLLRPQDVVSGAHPREILLSRLQEAQHRL